MKYSSNGLFATIPAQQLLGKKVVDASEFLRNKGLLIVSNIRNSQNDKKIESFIVYMPETEWTPIKGKRKHITQYVNLQKEKSFQIIELSQGSFIAQSARIRFPKGN